MVPIFGGEEAALIVALLFDAFGYRTSGNYWYAARERVFSAGLVQASGRHMRLSVGDAFVDGVEPGIVFQEVYQATPWRRLHETRLRSVLEQSIVFAMVFENMPVALAEALHERLSADSGYLGAMALAFEYGPHLALFRNGISAKYRLAGNVCRIFLPMGSEDAKDNHEPHAMRRLGYQDVDWEDRGAHKTIFDDFDTPRHFERVAAFRNAVTPLIEGGEDAAYELVMVLEDLNPKLFNALEAAVDRLQSAETEEDVAQASLSGRRYLVQLADVLFPPREAAAGQRTLGPQAYKNRLWAFIEAACGDEEGPKQRLGGEVDRLVGELNGGLHADKPKASVMQAFADVAQLTAELLALDPVAARNPYYAFRARMHEVLREGLARRECN